jgi:DNA repair protein RadC
MKTHSFTKQHSMNIEKEEILNALCIAEITLSYHPNVKPSLRPVISTSSDAINLLATLWDQDTLQLYEQFKVLLLNRRNAVLGLYHVSTGGITATVADPRLILAAALKAAAVSVILAHNHPSGGVKPSENDVALTMKLKEGASYFDIKVLDHIIITAEEHFSFADEGLL